MSADETNKIFKGRHRDPRALYGFYLEQRKEKTITQDAAVDNIGADTENLVWLPLAKEMTMDEPTAVTITPTQGGGKLIENRGGIIYDISISGTTGYMPILEDQASIASAKSGGLPMVSDDEALTRSGYATFVTLRNLFRRYRQIKRDEAADIANSTFMHFLDTKLSDYWIVEPTSFSLSRSSRSPMTFNYAIKCRTICSSLSKELLGRFLPEDLEQSDFTLGVSDEEDDTSTGTGFVKAKTTSKITSAAFADRVREINTSIRSTIRTASGFVKQKTSELLDNVNALVGLLRLPAFLQNEIFNTVLNVLKQLDDSLAGMEEAIQSLSNVDDIKVYNEMYLELRNMTESIGARLSNVAKNTPFDKLLKEDTKYTQRRALTSGETGSLSVQPFLTTGGLDSARDTKVSGYTGVKLAHVMRGDTIFSMAARETGDVQRFADIIILNRLIYPYVAEDDGSGINRTSGVLFPGDVFLVPTNDKNAVKEIDYDSVQKSADRFRSTLTAIVGLTLVDDTQAWAIGRWVGFSIQIGSEVRIIVASDATTVEINRAFDTTPVVGSTYELRLDEFHVSKPVTAIEAVYGRDILARFNPDGTISAVLGPTGDLLTITGPENYVQALRLLTGVELGELLCHPRYGRPVGIGSRNDTRRLELYRFLLERQIISDPRTSAVKQVQIQSEAGATLTTIKATPVGVGNDVTVQSLS